MISTVFNQKEGGLDDFFYYVHYLIRFLDMPFGAI
jgi:hypothetical protein